MSAFYRAIRVFAAVTLFFFCWAYLPLYEAVAHAATPQSKGTIKQSPAASTKDQEKPEARFEKALEDIRKTAVKAEEKTDKDEDASAEIGKIITKRAEIESLDVDLKKEFSNTENKLKDAKLPKEILDRHYKFVKHYEDNLKELRANLNDVEQAKTKTDRKAKIDKVKLHLEKVKPPKKHIPLDPNKLPNRMMKAKTRAPRLKKEDFERDFRQQKNRGTKTALATEADSLLSLVAKREYAESQINPQAVTNRKPILLAFNGPASDMSLSLGNGRFTPLPSDSSSRYPVLPIAFSSPLILAQAAATQPTSDDLAQTSEVQFTQDIQDLAAQLNHSPVKIFEWVKNNIEFVPSYGSIQGANMCLQTSQCNDMDTASLIIALLRVSNIPAHYVYGTIEVPMDKVMNWAGGFTDPNSAASAISSGGIPAAGKLSGGVLSALRMEHVWVEAFIPYGNYRGAIMDQSIKTWIPMDGSFKQYTYTNGFDMTATVPFSQDTYLSQVQTQNPVHYYQSQIQAYLDANMPNTSIVDVKGYRQITQETYHFLPSTLPYATVVVLGKYSAVPAGMAATATFTLSDPATGSNVSYTASTYDLAGKRVTVSYLPATSADEALIASYGGFLYNVPAYMLNLVPVLKVEGAIQLTGEATTLGSGQNLSIQFTQPSGMNESINKNLIAGAYYAVGMDLQGVNENVLGKRNYNLTTNVLSQTAGTLGNDDLIGEHLHILATTYFLANDKIYKSGAKLYNTTVTRTLSEGITSFTLSVSYLFGISKAAMPSGVNMDVAMDRVIVIAKDGNTSKEIEYMNIAGLVSSYNEHDIFEKIDGFSSVSTVRALQVASANGIAIEKINSSNIAQILLTLQVGPDITTDIQNAVNAGKEVTISQKNVQINDWNGVGYIVKDSFTGSGSYLISGGLAGSDSTSKKDGSQIVMLYQTPNGWIRDRVDPQTRNTIASVANLEIGEPIVLSAAEHLGQSYNDVDRCSGLVRRAYWAAGICLDEWANCGTNLMQRYGLLYNGNGVYYHYLLAVTENLNGGVRDHDPLIGDIVFFNDTTGANQPLSHEGIVIAPSSSDDATVTFIDASNSGVGIKYLNTDYPNISTSPLDGRVLNTFLADKPCTKCYAGELFVGYGTIRNP